MANGNGSNGNGGGIGVKLRDRSKELGDKVGNSQVVTSIFRPGSIFRRGYTDSPRNRSYVILLTLTLLLSFTGYLLPWDQLALWAVTVGTNMMGYTPVFGGQMRYALLGSKEISGDTLLRWYTLHVLLLPFVIVIFMAIHFW